MELEEMLTLMAKRLSVIRHEKKLSIEMLSRQSGVSKNEIQRIEEGKTDCDIESLYRMAVAMNIPISYFFDFNQEQ